MPLLPHPHAPVHAQLPVLAQLQEDGALHVGAHEVHCDGAWQLGAQVVHFDGALHVGAHVVHFDGALHAGAHVDVQLFLGAHGGGQVEVQQGGLDEEQQDDFLILIVRLGIWHFCRGAQQLGGAVDEQQGGFVAVQQGGFVAVQQGAWVVQQPVCVAIGTGCASVTGSTGAGDWARTTIVVSDCESF